MTKILNFTPHDIVLMNSEKDITKTFSSVGNARMKTLYSEESRMELPYTQESGLKTYVAVKGVSYEDHVSIPSQENDTFYIVSMLVAQSFPERKDLICPDTSPDSVVRDDKGQIIGVRQFVCYWKAD